MTSKIETLRKTKAELEKAIKEIRKRRNAEDKKQIMSSIGGNLMDIVNPVLKEISQKTKPDIGGITAQIQREIENKIPAPFSQDDIIRLPFKQLSHTDEDHQTISRTVRETKEKIGGFGILLNANKLNFEKQIGILDERIKRIKVIVKHNELLAIGPDDHHSEEHYLESHIGLKISTKNLNRLVDGDEVDDLHTHKAEGGKRLMFIGGAGGGDTAGTVTTVSVVTANGVSGTVATPTSTPAITLTLGAITPSSVTVSGLTASEIVGTDADKKLVSLAVATYPSLTELTYVKGVTSALQTQLGLKAPLASPTFTGTVTIPTPFTLGAVSVTATGTELNYVAGVTSAIQTQLGTKAATDQTMYIGTTAVAINRASAALTLAGLTLTTPDIGTPSAGVLTNCTGLPAASVLAGSFGAGAFVISTSLQAATLEIGHATDTTLSRSAVGVLAVEGVVIPSISSTNTLTNKRITLREGTVTDSATPTPASDDVDIYTVTALAQAATFGAPTGTPTQGQKLIIRIKDNATARALSWNAIYRSGTDVALPTTTVLSKTLYCGFVYNSTDTKWDLLAKTDNI